MEPFLGELQQQAERVAIGGNGVRADFPLCHQTGSEERLQQGRKISGIPHSRPPSVSPASWRPPPTVRECQSDTSRYARNGPESVAGGLSSGAATFEVASRLSSSPAAAEAYGVA